MPSAKLVFPAIEEAVIMNKTAIVLTLAGAAFSSAGFAQSAAGGNSGNGPVPAERSSAQDSTIAPSTGSSMSSTSSVPSATAAPGYATDTTIEGLPRSRLDVQAEGTSAMHSGDVARGEALVTRDRPHGGPLNADGMSSGTNGIYSTVPPYSR
jgi:hypothetical protein